MKILKIVLVCLVLLPTLCLSNNYYNQNQEYIRQKIIQELQVKCNNDLNNIKIAIDAAYSRRDQQSYEYYVWQYGKVKSWCDRELACIQGYC